MTSKFGTFKSLHAGDNLFILPNAWDAQSAAIFQEAGYPAVGTSSAAVATSLGHSDGEGMPFADYLFVIRRILASVNIPVTVDIEMGYGNTPEEIYDNLQKLIALGVTGINIEDSVIVNGSRSLNNADAFAKTIGFITNKLAQAKDNLFVNVRCDTYILKVQNIEAETIRRLKLYESAGADGIFLPLISDIGDIEAAVAATRLPINVMTIPGLPAVTALSSAGVKRLSMGPFLHAKTYQEAKALAVKVAANHNIDSIL